MEKRSFEYWFACLSTISGKEKRRLREEVDSAEELYYIEETRLQKCIKISDDFVERIVKHIENWRLEEAYEKAKEKGIHFRCFFEEDFPERLRYVDDVPYAIFFLGQLPNPLQPCVAIVGARRCSPYGESMARWFGRELGAMGVPVVSGLAKGIDGMAQRAVINNGGVTYGVLGSGVDICYPRDHMGLYTDLQIKGGILSEQPPGSAPIPRNFPLRNRIISGLADIVIVVEAKLRSGSLITADQAMEQGKDVYASPGPLDSELSKGCNRLIKQGAGILLSPEDCMQEMEICCTNTVNLECSQKIVLESTENMVYSVLDFRAQEIEQIMRRTKMPVSELMGVLISLEIKGYIREISKNYYAKIK